MDIIKRLDSLLIDTTCSGDVAHPQGKVIGMQYRRKKKKVKGEPSYSVHEATKYRGMDSTGIKRAYKDIMKALKPEMSRKPELTRNKEWWMIEIRDEQYFTNYDADPDNDYKEFTGQAELEKKLSRVLRGYPVMYLGQEKDWVQIRIKNIPKD